MSTFDATSTDPAYASLPGGYGYDNDAPGPAPTAGMPRPDYVDEAVTSRSTLDELRAAAAEEDPREPITVVNPRDTIRLTLRTNIEESLIQKWRNKALPLKEREKLSRRGGQPNLSRLDPVVMFASAIADTAVLVEVRSRATGEWVPVVDEHSGDPLTFADTALRQVLGGLDTISAVKRAFNRSEPALLEAAQRMLDASGFGDTDADGDGAGEDPTSAAG